VRFKNFGTCRRQQEMKGQSRIKEANKKQQSPIWGRHPNKRKKPENWHMHPGKTGNWQIKEAGVQDGEMPSNLTIVSHMTCKKPSPA